MERICYIKNHGLIVFILNYAPWLLCHVFADERFGVKLWTKSSALSARDFGFDRERNTGRIFSGKRI